MGNLRLYQLPLTLVVLVSCLQSSFQKDGDSCCANKLVSRFCISLVLAQKLCLREDMNVQVRHGKTREYLYTAHDDWAPDSQKRRVFTWRNLKDDPSVPGSGWNGEEVWRLEILDDMDLDQKSNPGILVRLKSARYSNSTGAYLFVEGRNVYTSRSPVQFYKEDYPSKLSFSAKWRLVPIVKDGQCSQVNQFNLRSVKHSGNLLGEEEDYYIRNGDDSRRNILVDECTCQIKESLWEIVPLV